MSFNGEKLEKESYYEEISNTYATTIRTDIKVSFYVV